MLIDNGYQSLITASQTDPKSHPLRQLTIKDSNLFHYETGGRIISNRQELSPVFRRNGLAYVENRDYLIRGNSIIGDKLGALVIDRLVVNIDDKGDLELAEFLLSKDKNGTSIEDH